ncbi:hypothetical protein HOK51_02045 [Candidatus Woesearchaeota archaeon]|nr:hypothetical protein [Candidatus Woesearchaeota archaeon]MBT6518597.1 hypothetical protein [Candidatus Woesearchaeota archaeon]MBT7367462.1 hypothetical protein [Candidatus Woesearchaeota archaeon]
MSNKILNKLKTEPIIQRAADPILSNSVQVIRKSNSPILFENKKQDIVDIVDEFYNSLSVCMSQDSAIETKVILEKKHNIALRLDFDSKGIYTGKVSVVESASLHQGHIKYLMSDKQYDHFLITTDCSRYGPHLEASVNMVCELFNLNVKKDQFPLVLKDNRNNNAAAVLGSYLVFPTDTGSFNISNPKREVFGTVKLNKNYVNKGVSLKKPLLYSIVKEIYQANTGV